MKRIAMFLAAVTSLALFSMPATAQQAKNPFTGVYVGGHVGGAVVDTQAAIPGVISDGGTLTTAKFGGQMGYNFGPTSWSLIGIEVGGSLYRLRDGSSPILGASGLALDKSAYGLARVGWLFTKNTALYGGAGYQWTWVTDLVAGGTTFNAPKAEGVILAGGVEHVFGKHFTVDARYTAHLAQDASIAVAPGTALNLDRVSHDLTLRANFKF